MLQSQHLRSQQLSPLSILLFPASHLSTTAYHNYPFHQPTSSLATTVTIIHSTVSCQPSINYCLPQLPIPPANIFTRNNCHHYPFYCFLPAIYQLLPTTTIHSTSQHLHSQQLSPLSILLFPVSHLSTTAYHNYPFPFPQPTSSLATTVTIIHSTVSCQPSINYCLPQLSIPPANIFTRNNCHHYPFYCFLSAIYQLLPTTTIHSTSQHLHSQQLSPLSILLFPASHLSTTAYHNYPFHQPTSSLATTVTIIHSTVSCQPSINYCLPQLPIPPANIFTRNNCHHYPFYCFLPAIYQLLPTTTIHSTSQHLHSQQLSPLSILLFPASHLSTTAYHNYPFPQPTSSLATTVTIIHSTVSCQPSINYCLPQLPIPPANIFTRNNCHHYPFYCFLPAIYQLLPTTTIHSTSQHLHSQQLSPLSILLFPASHLSTTAYHNYPFHQPTSSLATTVTIIHSTVSCQPSINYCLPQLPIPPANIFTRNNCHHYPFYCFLPAIYQLLPTTTTHSTFTRNNCHHYPFYCFLPAIYQLLPTTTIHSTSQHLHSQQLSPLSILLFPVSHLSTTAYHNYPFPFPQPTSSLATTVTIIHSTVSCQPSINYCLPQLSIPPANIFTRNNCHHYPFYCFLPAIYQLLPTTTTHSPSQHLHSQQLSPLSILLFPASHLSTTAYHNYPFHQPTSSLATTVTIIHSTVSCQPSINYCLPQLPIPPANIFTRNNCHHYPFYCFLPAIYQLLPTTTIHSTSQHLHSQQLSPLSILLFPASHLSTTAYHNYPFHQPTSSLATTVTIIHSTVSCQPSINYCLPQLPIPPANIFTRNNCHHYPFYCFLPAIYQLLPTTTTHSTFTRNNCHHYPFYCFLSAIYQLLPTTAIHSTSQHLHSQQLSPLTILLFPVSHLSTTAYHSYPFHQPTSSLATTVTIIHSTVSCKPSINYCLPQLSIPPANI